MHSMAYICAWYDAFIIYYTYKIIKMGNSSSSGPDIFSQIDNLKQTSQPSLIKSRPINRDPQPSQLSPEQQQQLWEQQNPRFVIQQSRNLSFGVPIYFIGHGLHEYKMEKSDPLSYILHETNLNSMQNDMAQKIIFRLVGKSQIKNNSKNIDVVYVTNPEHEEMIIGKSEFERSFIPFDPQSYLRPYFQPTDWVYFIISPIPKRSMPSPVPSPPPPTPTPALPPSTGLYAAGGYPPQLHYPPALPSHIDHNTLAHLLSIYHQTQRFPHPYS